MSVFVSALRERGVHRLLDCTVGGGGHARALLRALPSATLLGLDCDPAAVAASRAALCGGDDGFASRTRIVRARWPDGIEEARRGADDADLLFDGVLLDAGVSSHQLDTPSRGFSFSSDGPLDMRLSGTCSKGFDNDVATVSGSDTATTTTTTTTTATATATASTSVSTAFNTNNMNITTASDSASASLTAGDLVNHAPEAALRGAISAFGEEPNAGTIARAIVNARAGGRRIETTTELARIVSRAVGLPRGAGAGGKHPATRTFQALRIAVNGELSALDKACRETLPHLVAPGGVLCVITFHSLEARLVKGRFAAFVKGGGWSSGGFIKPSAEECETNPRTRSAQLRYIIKR